MLSLIKALFSTLNQAQRKRFFRLQLLVIIMTIAEIISIAAIGPFMLLLTNIQRIEHIDKLQMLYQLSGANTVNEFILIASAITLLIIFCAAAISIFTVWQLAHFTSRIGAEMSNRLFTFYLNKNWLYHSVNDSTKLSNKITSEANRVANLIIQPLMNLNAKLLLALGICIGIFIMEPMIAVSGIALFLIAYSLLYLTLKSKLLNNSHAITSLNRKRFQKQMEGFGGIRDTLILNRQQSVIEQFSAFNIQLAKRNSTNTTMTIAPRYFMEFIAISAVILLVVFLTLKHQGNLGEILPLLAIYGLAGLKLLPACQQSYQNIATIKSATASFNHIKDDLIASLHHSPNEAKQSVIDFNEQLSINNVSFSYPNQDHQVISNLSLAIQKNQHIAFVGASGSGKSTLVDIISGLLIPNKGQILIDKTQLNAQTIKSWQRKIGFVSQHIYLVNSTIRQNVAFGLAEDAIDDQKVTAALKMAHLTELVTGLKNNIHTEVGERGVQLSGGQRQRIGIARALYHDPEILIFDEATSALDGNTESAIKDTINRLTGNKTIMTIAHRLTTIKNCDCIYLIDDGKIIDSGRFQQLVTTNKKFKKMANIKIDGNTNNADISSI